MDGLGPRRGTGTFSAPAGWQQQVIQDLLLPVLRDKNVEAMRRLRAIRALGEQGFVFGADAVVDVLADTAEESDVRTAAYWVLESISGQSFGANIEAWRTWWDALSESAKCLAADPTACTLKP